MMPFCRLLSIGLFILFLQVVGVRLSAQQMHMMDKWQTQTTLRELKSSTLTHKERIGRLFYLGIMHNKYGNTDSARYYFNEALAVPGGKEFEGGRIAVNIANSYVLDGRNSKALKYYQEAVDIAENSQTDEGQYNIVRAMANLSECYFDMGNHSWALDRAEYALKVFNELNGSPTFYILPQIYYVIGAVQLEKGELELAEEYFRRTYDISNVQYQSILNSGGIAIYMSYGMEGLARIHLNRKEYDEALDCAGKALVYAEEDGNVAVVVKALATLSDIYLAQKQYENSREFASRAMKFTPTAIKLSPSIAYNMAVVELYAGNKEQALQYLQEYSRQVKLNTDKNFQEMMASMEVQHGTERREIRIAALEKDRRLYISLGVSITAALLLGMGLLFYRHRSAVQRRRMAEQQIRQLEQEQELVVARSALDAEKAEREIIARDLHDGVGAMLSVVKNNMNIMKSVPDFENREAEYFNKALDGLDKSIVELRRVAHHIMPAVLMEKGLATAVDDFCRSVPDAEFHYSEPECRRFDSEKELVLYRCTYELVSNALRHAGASLIDVHLNMDEDTVYLSVVDNGCGFDLLTAPQGMGIKNLRTRLSVFGGEIEIYSEPGKGTEVDVEMKI